MTGPSFRNGTCRLLAVNIVHHRHVHGAWALTLLFSAVLDLLACFPKARMSLAALSVVHLDRSVCQGDAQELLLMMHFALLGASRLVAAYTHDQGYDLYAKDDLRFLQGIPVGCSAAYWPIFCASFSSHSLLSR